MQKHTSFSTRVLLSFWVVLLVALLLPPWYYYHILTREVLGEARTNAIQQINLLHWMLEREKNLPDIESLQTWLNEVELQPGNRISYVAEGGRVIADSQVPFDEIPKLDNHANRPEIVEASGNQPGVSMRYSRTSEKDLIYVARKLPRNGPIPAGTLRLAAPLTTAMEPLVRLKDSLVVFAVLTFLATALLTLALVRRLNHPMREMIEAAEAISTRDYKRRIRSSPGHEFQPLIDSINRMADSIENHVRTITGQKQQLEGVFNAMREAVMVLDSDGRVRSTNRTFQEILSSGESALGRRPLEVMLNLELQKLCDRILASAPLDGETRPSSLQIGLGNNRAYDVNIVRLPASQEDSGAVVVLHDITSLKRLERVRQDFVANVSHELRTPLTSIKGYTETLLSDPQPKPETLSNFLQVILKNTDNMVKMVDDLLQLARLEAHQETLHYSPVDASSAMAAAWRACSQQAEAKKVRLRSNLPKDGVRVLGDYDQLDQVFRNLLENAIRYSPEGEAITISCESLKNWVLFHVRDEGPGIPKQHQERIFERFYRVEKHRGEGTGRTGIGLAICRHIIANHGGTIGVESPNPGSVNGATFSFTVLDAAGQPRNSPEQSGSKGIASNSAESEKNDNR